MINLEQNLHHNIPTNPLTTVTVPPTQQTRRSMIPHTDNPGPLITETHLDDILALELSDTLINAAYNLSAMKINLAIQKICVLERMFILNMSWGFESIKECSNRDYKVGLGDRLGEVCVLREINNNLEEQKEQEHYEEKEVIVEKITYPIILTREQQEQKLFITVRERLEKMSKIMTKKHNVKLYEAFISISNNNSSRRRDNNNNSHNNNEAMLKTNNREVRRSSEQEQESEWSQIKSYKNITANETLFNKMSKEKPKSKTIISNVMCHDNDNNINIISSSISNRATVTNSHLTNNYNKSMDNSNNSNSSNNSKSKSITKFNPIRLPKRNINNNINTNNNYTQSEEEQELCKEEQEEQKSEQQSNSNKETKSKTKERELESLRSKYNKLVEEFHIFSQRFLSVIKEEEQ